jgi:hypothetical protein
LATRAESRSNALLLSLLSLSILAASSRSMVAILLSGFWLESSCRIGFEMASFPTVMEVAGPPLELKKPFFCFKLPRPGF